MQRGMGEESGLGVEQRMRTGPHVVAGWSNKSVKGASGLYEYRPGWRPFRHGATGMGGKTGRRGAARKRERGRERGVFS